MTDLIEGTGYLNGAEVQQDDHLNCPEECAVPPGLRLVQVVAPGTAFSIRCPNECGLALRMVEA